MKVNFQMTISEAEKLKSYLNDYGFRDFAHLLKFLLKEEFQGKVKFKEISVLGRKGSQK